MRKFVTSLVVLALAILIMGCDGSFKNSDGSSEYNPKRPPESKDLSDNKKQIAKISDTSSDVVSLPDSTIMLMAGIDSSDTKAMQEFAAQAEGIELGDDEPDPLDEYDGYESEGYLDLPKGDGVGRERLLNVLAVKVINPNIRNTKDSILYVVEQRLAIVPESSKRIVIVEKWFSPVNFKGYKFNRKKILLYGVDKDRPVAVYFYLENFYIAFGERLYELDETTAYTPFFAVKDSSLSRYLLNYEPRL